MADYFDRAMIEALVKRIRSEASLADRPVQMGRLEGIANDVALLAAHPCDAPPVDVVAARIGLHGPCPRRDRHDPHIETTGIVDTSGNIVLDECPGQVSDCANCDDQKCMACQFREVHDVCRDDCPDCCPSDSAVLVSS